jgi:hypothetical protein
VGGNALSDPVLGRILTNVATALIEPNIAQSDEMEVLRALLDRRLVVQSAAPSVAGGGVRSLGPTSRDPGRVDRPGPAVL